MTQLTTIGNKRQAVLLKDKRLPSFSSRSTSRGTIHIPIDPSFRACMVIYEELTFLERNSFDDTLSMKRIFIVRVQGQGISLKSA